MGAVNRREIKIAIPYHSNWLQGKWRGEGHKLYKIVMYCYFMLLAMISANSTCSLEALEHLWYSTSSII